MRQVLISLVFVLLFVVGSCDNESTKTPLQSSNCSVVSNKDGSITIVCDDGSSVTIESGKDGGSGKDGKSTLVSLSDEPQGDNCSYGGVRIDAGVDENNNGVLEESEITDTKYICNASGEGETGGPSCVFGQNRFVVCSQSQYLLQEQTCNAQGYWEDNEDCFDAFPRQHNGLDWSNPSTEAFLWRDGVKYCADLGGRLPSLGELRSLIRNCPSTQPGGACGVTDSCLSSNCRSEETCVPCASDMSGKYNVFGFSGTFWSGSTVQDDFFQAWRVRFDTGSPMHVLKNENYFIVYCVRL